MILWDEEGLWLFTPDELKQLPNGIELTSIMNDTAIKGIDDIDYDVRFGHTAWGVYDPLNHKYSHLFTVFGLKR